MSRKPGGAIKCPGCGELFHYISPDHIKICQELIDKGIKSRKDLIEIYGIDVIGKCPTSKNLIKYNKSKSMELKVLHGKRGMKITEDRYGSKDFHAVAGRSALTKLWSTKEFRKMMTDLTKQMNASGKMSKGMNGLETLFSKLINNNDVEFVGHLFWKTVRIGEDVRYITPDFKVKFQDKVIEVNGSYWHTKEDSDLKESLWKSVGMQCLTIWDYEIYDNPESVFNKVNEFIA